MISDSRFCFEQHSGSFSEPISGSQRSDVIQALQPITCGSETFKCRNLMSSSVSEPPRLCVSHPSLCPPTLLQLYHLHQPPSTKNHISKLLVPLQAIRRQVASVAAAGSCFSVLSSEQVSLNGVSWRLYTDKNQLPPSANLLHGEKWRKSEGNFNFIWKGLPFHLEGLQQQNNHIDQQYLHV